MRAARVADSLPKCLEIPLNGIEVVANGSTKPFASNRTLDGRAENRRTEVLLYH
jgi:flagellar motor protein MotB